MSETWHIRALDAQRRGDLWGTLEACASAPMDAESQVLAQTVRAATLLKLGRLAEALQAVREAFRLGGSSVELHRLAAKVMLSRGDLEGALEWVNRALEIGHASPRTLELREKIISRTHLLSGLFEHMQLAVELHPEDTGARDKLIRSCLELRIFPEATRHLEIAVARDPGRARLHIDLAVAHIEMARAALATEELERALTLSSDPGERTQIVRLLIRAQALERAVSVAEANSTLSPNDPRVRLQSAFLWLWQGDVAKAVQIGGGMPERTPGLFLLRAAVAFVRADYLASVELATRAVSDDDKDAEARALCAAALFCLNRHEEAEESALSASHTTKEWLPAAQLVLLGARAGLHTTVRRFEAAELFELLGPLWSPSVVLPDEVADIPSPPVLAAIRQALARLSGNFTSALTFVTETEKTWSCFPLKPPARTACLRVFDSIHAYPWARVAEEMRALATSYPRSPFVFTHTAEIWLWYGDYPACEAECRKALALSKIEGSRWAWVGLGGSLMLQERYTESLAVFAELARIVQPADQPSAPLLAYRGELLRRTGDLDAARNDLARAVTRTPSRVGAWVNLALVAIAEKQHDEAREIYARLTAQMPALTRDIERDSSIPAAADRQDPDVLRAILEHALRAMRGNRSSNRITYFLRDGLARVLTAST